MISAKMVSDKVNCLRDKDLNYIDVHVCWMISIFNYWFLWNLIKRTVNFFDIVCNIMNTFNKEMNIYTYVHILSFVIKNYKYYLINLL